MEPQKCIAKGARYEIINIHLCSTHKCELPVCVILFSSCFESFLRVTVCFQLKHTQSYKLLLDTACIPTL